MTQVNPMCSLIASHRHQEKNPTSEFQNLNMMKSRVKKNDNALMTTGGHLEVMRRMIIRICAFTFCLAIVIFAFKDRTFSIILAPSEPDFIVYSAVEKSMGLFNPFFRFGDFHVDLIATDLSSQFMTHVSVSLYLALLFASPYILFEFFRFVYPALLDSERKYSVKISVAIFSMFILGVLMSYFVLFPVSFRFLGTYSVADKVHSSITLDSYISTFITLTLLMALVFQLPVAAYILAKMGRAHSDVLVRYRKYAFLIICIVAAVITPPDLMTLIFVALPLYALYEVSICIIRKIENVSSDEETAPLS